MSEDTLTTAEVAKVLRLHSNTVVKLAASGEIPGAKIGRKIWRFRAADIANLLKPTNTKQAEPAVARP